MLSAFQAQAIHEFKPRDKSKVESLLAYGDRLLVGLNTGSLRIYRVNENTPTEELSENGSEAPPPSPTKVKAVDLLRDEEKFSKKPVQQLAIVKEANLLVSLSDGYISLHDLQTYQLVERLERTKGAACFTVSSNVVKDPETSVPSLVSRLAVGVKRKLMCWTWRDMEMEADVAEITVEASVKSLTWANGSRIVIGMDPGFSIVDIETQEITPISKPVSRTAADPNSGELAGVRFGAVSSSGMGYMGMGSWVPKPMATGLSDGHVLVAKDVNTLFTDIDGKALEKRQVPWALAPEAIGYSYPYMLALLPPEKGALQIRNPDTLSLLQTISLPSANVLHVPQPNISLAHAGKGFLVASDRVIWRMNALPYDAQLRELVEKQRFDEAISLLNLLEDTLIEDKADRIREVMVQKAIALFQQRKYRPALDLFTDAEAPPERVIALYPKSVAGELSTVPESTDQSEAEPTSEDADNSKSDEVVAKDMPAAQSKGMLSKFKSGGHARKDSDTASIKASPKHDSDNMSIRTPTKGAQPIKPPVDKPLEGDDLRTAVRCLYSYLAYARVQFQKYLNIDGTLKEDPPTLDPETHKPAFANLLSSSVFEDRQSDKDTKWQAELLSTAQLVDTTLFRAYMLAGPTLAGSLFRLDNFCDPEVVQASLYENDRYGDLIDFLHGKRLHRQALEMLQKFGRQEADAEVPEGMRGPGRTVAYLKQLPPELIDIILEFVKWPIESTPQTGMEVFLADSENAEHLPRRKVLHFLADIDDRLEAQYLEHIIDELGDQTPEFHQQLVDIYISELKSPPASDATSETVKTKLEAFLRKSKAYNKVQTWRQLPDDTPSFYESRALVCSAMGNHKQALAIYVLKLADYDKAEEYCHRTYLSDQQACLIDATTTHEKAYRPAFEPEDSPNRPNIFAILLGLYLRPPAGEEKRWPQALDLLSRHGARLPASSTLDFMPDDLAVKELHDYFRGRIRNATSILREEKIIQSLESVRRVNAERHLLLGADEVQGDGKPHGRNRRVRITEEDHCRVCHKRFGASAIRVHPDGGVVHYGCVGKRPGEVMGGGSARRGSARAFA